MGEAQRSPFIGDIGRGSQQGRSETDPPPLIPVPIL